MRKISSEIAEVVGAERTIEFFAWFPVSVETYKDYVKTTETRWLEKVRVRQMYRRISWTSGFCGDGYGWNNEKFLE